MIDKDNEINLEDLEGVTGGTMPFSNNGIRMGAFPPKETVLNSMENNVIKRCELLNLSLIRNQKRTDGYLIVRSLSLYKFCEEAVLCDQLIVCTLLGDLPAVKNEDPVAVLDGT